MDVQIAAVEPRPFIPEPAELEQALQALDVNEEDFDERVREIAELVGGGFLFAMPAADEDSVRIAAVGFDDDGDARTLLVSLLVDGASIRVEDASESASPHAALARSSFALARSLAIAPREPVTVN